jgi:hypothetical protein
MNTTRKASIRQKVTKKSDVITFGKYKGVTVADILSKEASYILWLDTKEIVDFSEDLIEIAETKANEQHREWLYDHYEDTGEHDDWGDRD